MRIPVLLLALSLAAPARAEEPTDEPEAGDPADADDDHAGDDGAGSETDREGTAADADEILVRKQHDATFTISPLLVVLPIGCEEVVPTEETPGRNCPNWTIELTGEFPFAPHHTGSLIAGFGWRITEDGLRRSTIVGGQYRWYPFQEFQGFHVGLELQRLDFTLATTIAATQGGPVLGYKVAAPFGLTTELQLGAGARFFQGQAQLTVLFNLQLGWSFDLSPEK